MKPRLCDLFCGAGGAAVGYHRAGFDVVGVDINPQPNYPFEFHQADAMAFPLDGFDAIHASPPCQDHSALKSLSASHGTGWMLAETLERLEASGIPYVVENVPGSEGSMGGQWTMLCGSSFGLKVRRHRLFRASFVIMSLPCDHRTQGQPIGVYGNGGGTKKGRGWKGTLSESREAMGIDWMNRREISQAIPPSYTEWIGRQLLDVVQGAARVTYVDRPPCPLCHSLFTAVEWETRHDDHDLEDIHERCCFSSGPCSKEVA